MVLQLLEGRSPLVPNDVDLGVGEDATRGCLIVSGPNMGGKSRCVGWTHTICLRAE